MNRKTILVIDDDSSFTDALKSDLADRGEFEVHIVTRAENALAAAQAVDPDLIIIDIVMPRMLGGEVATRFLTDVRMRSIPVVFLTTTASGTRPLHSYGSLCGYPVYAKPAQACRVGDLIEAQIHQHPGNRIGLLSVRFPPNRPHLTGHTDYRVPSPMA
jgi:CheY-like chemotaxis protein